jgi:uncharacterized RDD family membrane protein YckC
MSHYGSDPTQPDPNRPDPAGSGQQPGPPPPPNPYGEPAPYAPQPGQDPYGAPSNPYGAPANPYAPTAAELYGRTPVGVPANGYASWLKRVGAYLVDLLCGIMAGIPLWIGYGIVIANTKTTTDTAGVQHTSTSHVGTALLLILLGIVTYTAFWIWNYCIRQGRTGYTIGKGTMGIRLLDEPTSRPVGAFMAFLRQIVHIVDGLCYIGYLWPLWDAKKQTFTDKILHTVVINEPEHD